MMLYYKLMKLVKYFAFSKCLCNLRTFCGGCDKYRVNPHVKGVRFARKNGTQLNDLNDRLPDGVVTHKG